MPQARRVTIQVAVRATDPLVQVGVTGELSKAAGLLLVDDEADADVVVAVAESGLRTMLSAPTRLVLVADEPREGELWAALEYGLVVLIPRAEATPQRMLRAIADAHHERGHLPADQLGDLLRGLSRLHENTLAPRDLTLSVLSRRETEVVQLLSEGLGTAEIATKLNYSERTVKNVLHDLQARLGLRNRAHAVAHALRQGLI